MDLLGEDLPVSRAAALLAGARPRSQREAELQRILVDAARALGYTPGAATA
jgi:hypothetical protein